MSLKNNKINITNKLYRERGPKISRHNFLRLDKNERISKFDNIFFKKILKKISHEHLTSYPELEEIYSLLSKENKLNKKSFVITPGSDGGIRLCFELFVKPKDKIITLSPTFAMVDIYSKIFGAKQLKVGFDKKLNIKTNQLFNFLKKRISLIIIANPNSPTGTIMNNTQIVKILKIAKRKKVAVLIDEAYFGFSKYTSVPLIKKFNNLIIARTFSKSYGLAGCRAGYLTTNRYIAKQLFSLKPMYEINSIAALIIKEFIKKKIEKKYVKQNAEGKNFLINCIKNYKFNYFDTFANFIHIDFGKKRKKILKIFKRENILVKGGPGIKELKNYVRITTGPTPEMKKIIKIIKRVS